MFIGCVRGLLYQVLIITPCLGSETLCIRTLSGLQTSADQLSLLCIWAMLPGHDCVLDRHHLEFHHLWPKVGSLSSLIVSYLWWPLTLMKLCLIIWIHFIKILMPFPNIIFSHTDPLLESQLLLSFWMLKILWLVLSISKLRILQVPLCLKVIFFLLSLLYLYKEFNVQPFFVQYWHSKKRILSLSW